MELVNIDLGSSSSNTELQGAPEVCPEPLAPSTSCISYKDLLGKDPGRVETLGHKLNQNFDVFKNLPCDHSNAVSATGATQ